MKELITGWTVESSATCLGYMKYGPDYDATMAQCCAYLPLSGQIYWLARLGFLHVTSVLDPGQANPTEWHHSRKLDR